VREVLVKGPTKASVVVHGGLQVDLRLVEDSQFGALIQYFTGSQQHNIRIRDRANRMGLSINEYGITDLKSGQVETFATEEEVYSRLGLQYIPPEIREGIWEVEQAERNAIPQLIQLSDIKGDLHCHSEWSDGSETLGIVIAAAKARGYEYVAITDHSVGRGIARGLSPERLRSQMARIQELERQIGGIRVLTGSEVDIRADGSLDFPDDLLAELDVVVASVHSAMEQDQERMTARIIKAMRNPHVDIIGHLTTRLLGERDPIQVDVEAVFRAAAETRTALEINAYPKRLDLNDVAARKAHETGVMLAVSTDTHSLDQLTDMAIGVGVARRAWLEPRDVLNCLSRDQLLAWVRRKRAAIA
jgi:DNA polymerase (family 10)